MNDGKNMNQIISHNVEDSVRKPGQQGASNAGNDFWIQQRHLFEPFYLQLEGNFKLRAQPIALCLVPLECLPNFADRTARELQAVRHDPFFS